ncbi:type II toxin-antitoxin system RelE family toxin [Scytonema hofmannii]|uniref:type II toxin-antitoxin system RelE family toxin n=1 Tax=Scytonema hofmannii TaxID=34078 RepID=UPI003AF31D50
MEPRPNGVKKLENDLYRIRVGDYRVIYQIQDNILLVNIVKVSHRSKAYRDES